MGGPFFTLFVIMKKILAFVITIFILAGCGNKSEADKNVSVNKADSGAVRIAVQPTLESLPLIIAEERNLFDKCGVNVALIMYTSQAYCDTAMAERSADAMVTDIVRGKSWENENKKKLNFATWTNTHYMLISSKKARVKELSQMTDKLMAVTRNSVTDMLADSAIVRAGKTPQDMFKVQINDQEIRLNMLIESKMDAAFLQHPYAAEALARGGSMLMHGGKSEAGVLAFNKDTDEKDIKLILKAYDDACDSINTKGVMNYAPEIEKYMRKDIRKWNKYLKDIKFRHSHAVDADAMNKAAQWLKEN